MNSGEPNPFAELVAEMADGQRWRLLRAEGWDDFVERLTTLIVQLEPRRRQALVMLLVAMGDGRLGPEQARDWLGEHEVDSDGGLDALLVWLRQFRPSPDEALPGDDPPE